MASEDIAQEEFRWTLRTMAKLLSQVYKTLDREVRDASTKAARYEAAIAAANDPEKAATDIVNKNAQQVNIMIDKLETKGMIKPEQAEALRGNVEKISSFKNIDDAASRAGTLDVLKETLGEKEKMFPTDKTVFNNIEDVGKKFEKIPNEIYFNIKSSAKNPKLDLINAKIQSKTREKKRAIARETIRNAKKIASRAMHQTAGAR